MRKCVLLLAAVPLLAPAQQASYVDPGMKAVVQVAIVCRNVDATSRHWAAVLGVNPPKITLTKPGSEVKETYRGRKSGGQAKLAFIRTGQVVLEFIEPVGPGTSWREFLEKRGEGVQHIAFQVEDPEKAAQSFQALGMPVFHQGRYDNDSGSYRYVDSQKTLGVTVELLHSDARK